MMAHTASNPLAWRTGLVIMDSQENSVFQIRESLRPVVPLLCRVGVVGHRKVDAQAFAPLIEESFRMLCQSIRRVAEWPTQENSNESLQQAYSLLGEGDASPRLSLLSGFAPGTDQVAAAIWARMRASDSTFGTSQGLLPFIDPDVPDQFAWTDRPENHDGDTRVDLRQIVPGVFDAVTVLDGVASVIEFPARDPHLEQSRWLVRWSDVMVAVWNGLPAGGTGGTAETVVLAVRKGIPILWIDSSSQVPVLRLLVPDSLWSDTSASEIFDCLADLGQREKLAPRARFENLVESLAPAFLPPDEEASRLSRIDYSTMDSSGFTPTDPRSWAFANCRNHINRLLCTFIARSWQGFMRSLAPPHHANAPAAPWTPPLIANHADHADNAATFSGNLHRGTQAAFLVAAIVSVMLGTLPAAFAALPELAHSLKHWTVPAEALLLSLVIVVWNLRYFSTNHQRWSECRRLAERLRCLRATWPLGFDVADWKSERPRTWTEWQARAIRRAVGPPSGIMLASKLVADVDRLRTDPRGIIAGQAAYNELTSERLHVLHERLESIEKWAFAFLLLFLGFYVVGDWSHWHDIHFFAGPLVVASAVVPTLCAACLALDAKLGIEENYARTKRLAKDFAELDSRMRQTRSLAECNELMRDASRILLKDVDVWQDAAVRRKIAAL